MEFTIHIANVLYMLSYLMRDILWLRILTVLAASCLIPYFYFRSDPLFAAIYWNLLFTLLNVYWICHLLLERRPVRLTYDQQVANPIDTQQGGVVLVDPGGQVAWYHRNVSIGGHPPSVEIVDAAMRLVLKRSPLPI